MAAVLGTVLIQVTGTLFYGVLFTDVYVDRMRAVGGPFDSLFLLLAL
jgi:hypothetical protein